MKQNRSMLNWLLYKSQEYNDDILEILDRCAFDYTQDDAHLVETIFERNPNAKFPRVIRSRRMLSWILYTGSVRRIELSESLREQEIKTLAKKGRVNYFIQLYDMTKDARASFLIAIHSEKEEVIQGKYPLQIAMRILYKRDDTAHVDTVPFHQLVRRDDPVVRKYCEHVILDIEDIMPVEESGKCFKAVLQFRKYVSFSKVTGKTFKSLKEVFWTMMFRRVPRNNVVSEQISYEHIGILKKKRSWGRAFFDILRKTNDVRIDTMTEMIRAFEKFGPNVIKKYLFMRADEFARHNEEFMFNGRYVHDALIVIPHDMDSQLLLKYPYDSSDTMRTLLTGFWHVKRVLKANPFQMEREHLIKYAAVAEANMKLGIELYEDEKFLELVLRYGSTHTTQSKYDKLEGYWNARFDKGCSTIPYIRVEQADLILERLDDNDPVGMFLGYLTGCCQHIWGAAESCAVAGVTESYAGFWVVRTKPDMEIRAESFVWTYVNSLGQKTLVVDSIEGRAPSMLMSAEEKNRRRRDLRILYMKAATECIGKLGIEVVELGEGNIVQFSDLTPSNEKIPKLRCEILNKSLYSQDSLSRKIMVTKEEIDELKELGEIENIIYEEEHGIPDHKIIRDIERSVYPPSLREMQDCLTIGRILEYVAEEGGYPEYKVSSSKNSYMLFCEYPSGGKIAHYSANVPFVEICDLASKKGHESEAVFLLMSLRHRYLFNGYRIVFDARNETSKKLVERLLEKYPRITLDRIPVKWEWDNHVMWRYCLKEK